MTIRSAVALLLPTVLMAASSVHEFTLTSIDGKPDAFVRLQGQGRDARQRRQQMRLHAAIHRPAGALRQSTRIAGFVIVGVPANNFGGQEPGTNEEIKTFCTRNYNVTFPMMSKVSVKGDRQDAALWLSDGEHRRRRQMEFHQVPRG